jgi:hypothetical protein
MPIIMKKRYSISGTYTPDQIEVLEGLIDNFRGKMFDDDPEKNILIGKKNQYTDNKIISLLNITMNDINSGWPKTNYDLFQFVNLIDNDMPVDGAIVFALMGEGVLQLRNQVDYSDSGLSISMFNKTGLYQSWAGIYLQDYMAQKKEFKSTVIPRSENSGFYGIGTEFGYGSWW